MKRARIGQLRHRLTIQQKTNGAQDAMGGYSPTWSTFGTVYGAIEGAPANAKVAEKLSAGDAALVGMAVFIISCRYLAGVTRAMRVYHATTGQVYDIVDVNNVDERNRSIELLCKQVELT